MEFFLMRKNEIVTLCDLDASGNMLAYSTNYRNPDLALWDLPRIKII